MFDIGTRLMRAGAIGLLGLCLVACDGQGGDSPKPSQPAVAEPAITSVAATWKDHLIHTFSERDLLVPINLAVRPGGGQAVFAPGDGRLLSLPEGRNIASGFEAVRYPAYSHHGTLTYIGSKEGRDSLVVGGLAGASYDYVDKPKFAHSGGRFGYIANRDGSLHVIIEQSESQPFDQFSVSGPWFSSDGTEWAYIG